MRARADVEKAIVEISRRDRISLNKATQRLLEESLRKRLPGPDVTPHTLRHTRATHLLQLGVDIWDVAGLLGDTVSTIERTYGHYSPDYLGDTLR